MEVCSFEALAILFRRWQNVTSTLQPGSQSQVVCISHHADPELFQMQTEKAAEGHRNGHGELEVQGECRKRTRSRGMPARLSLPPSFHVRPVILMGELRRC